MTKRSFFLLCMLAGCGKSPNATASATPPQERNATAMRVVDIDPALVANGRISVAAVERRPPLTELRVAGEVRADEAASAEAGALVAGRVATLTAREGSHVERGQLLAWIESPDASRATADVLRARARADVAAKRLSRELLLSQQNATSAGAVEDARAEDAMARADLAAARTLLTTYGVAEPAQIGENQGLAVRVPVRAPIGGVIVERHAILGAAVSPDTTLFHIVAGSGVFVSASVPETATPPSEGSVARVIGRGDDSLRCDAVVDGNLHVVNDASRTVSVRLRPDTTCSWLTPGRYVDVILREPSANAPALVIASEAVVDIDGVPTVFVATDRAGAFSARPVRVRTTSGSESIVENGVTEGERVVTHGTLLLKGELLRASLEGQ